MRLTKIVAPWSPVRLGFKKKNLSCIFVYNELKFRGRLHSLSPLTLL